ncbi:zf-HC2 domain-containing protein [Silvibacterium acidisoli]|uniref:zf-HC2 domain-containing protein n=1 Tax=Acidobacteriaceae bacterium ZG23-2 TaxID=2883246 RepID=UPI00406CD66D
MILTSHNLLRGHVSDTELTLLVTNDLPLRRRARVERHLAACNACRERHGRFHETFSQVAMYHALQAMQGVGEEGDKRARLEALLNQLPEQLPHSGVARAKEVRRPEAPLNMNPILVSGLILAIASISCVFLWLQQSRPTITSNTLLVRAEAWDSAAPHGNASGVIRQTVEISTSQRTLKCTLYRDAQGKRKLRDQRVPPDQELLQKKLAEARIPWSSPLSATSYQSWHDSQRVREDRIRRSSGHLLVLTTTTPDGAVAAQSLTVRDQDFRPVSRTVFFRNSETVEIAELNYSVLPWDAVTNSLFESGNQAEGTVVAAVRPALPVLPPAPLTEEQLNDVELSARLALDRLHADTGEQVEISRSARGVEVHGITDTRERKHEIEAQLNMLPHVTASISSIEELKTAASQPQGSSSVKVMEMQTAATPLEIYYLAHGRDVAPLGSLAQRLFSSAFTINLETKAIEDLKHRFPSDENLSPIGSAALADLLFTHKHKLLRALEDEEQLLADTHLVITASTPASSITNADVTLDKLAERNSVLIRELALDKREDNRPAEAIVSELATSISDLNLRAHEVQVDLQNSMKLDNGK